MAGYKRGTPEFNIQEILKRATRDNEAFPGFREQLGQEICQELEMWTTDTFPLRMNAAKQTLGFDLVFEYNKAHEFCLSKMTDSVRAFPQAATRSKYFSEAIEIANEMAGDDHFQSNLKLRTYDERDQLATLCQSFSNAAGRVIEAENFRAVPHPEGMVLLRDKMEPGKDLLIVGECVINIGSTDKSFLKRIAQYNASLSGPMLPNRAA